MKKILLITILFFFGTFRSFAGYKVLDIPKLSEYLYSCSISEVGVCIDKALYRDEYNVILIKIIFNNNEIGKNDRDPKLVLELGMLSYLLLFNKEVSEKYNTNQNKSFFDLEIDSLGQNNVLILGKVISDKGNYVGYYGIDNKTGYLFHNISNNFDDALDFYIERYPNKEPKNKNKPK
ncbi:hypothetical protein [Vibrio caribbeanicus]|uniref:hypothetical protein n=1 Tax=Vibrio caribbeanicus TaxID=701175 RepID=UPI002284F98E|nr:hypothetical protein [Vibrio caribbeanicus]MCY9844204.1 hypothetical protein [Vibrio caribbeanicus]